MAMSANFEAAVSKTFNEENEVMIEAMNVANWLASENLPLTKHESLMQLLKDLGVPKIACFILNLTLYFFTSG